MLVTPRGLRVNPYNTLSLLLLFVPVRLFWFSFSNTPNLTCANLLIVILLEECFKVSMFELSLLLKTQKLVVHFQHQTKVKWKQSKRKCLLKLSETFLTSQTVAKVTMILSPQVFLVRLTRHQSWTKTSSPLRPCAVCRLALARGEVQQVPATGAWSARLFLNWICC